MIHTVQYVSVLSIYRADRYMIYEYRDDMVQWFSYLVHTTCIWLSVSCEFEFCHGVVSSKFRFKRDYIWKIELRGAALCS